jgi:hypothetical protein
VRYQACFLWALTLVLQCNSTPEGMPPPSEPPLNPGEQTCNPDAHSVRFDPPEVILAPGMKRPVRMTVDPDICKTTIGKFTSDNLASAAPPDPAPLDLRHATYDFIVTGGAIGKAKISVSIETEGQVGVAETVTADLPIDVRDPAIAKCSMDPSQDSATMLPLNEAATAVLGKGVLATAGITIPTLAFKHTDPFGFQAFTADISCVSAKLDVPDRAGLVAVGPAVKFAGNGGNIKQNTSQRREIDFAIPINPAAIPGPARLRHLEMIYTSARAKTPRTIQVTNAHVDHVGDGYVLRFRSPYFGTYQAAFDANAGTRWHTRHLTHRAIVGVSMGGAGAATMGIRHHDKFDAVGALGGAFSDWTYFLWYVENYLLAGFCPASNPNCQKYAPADYPFDEPYAHTQDFNHMWYEPGNGNGGSVPRSFFMEAFHDFAVISGNPNSQNDDPSLAWFARGAKTNDPFVVGNATGLPNLGGTQLDCRMWTESLKGCSNGGKCLPKGANVFACDNDMGNNKGCDPQNPLEDQWRNQCIAARCDPKNALIFPTGYYDDDFNPNGTEQVISFCDNGIQGDQRAAAAPYGNTWAPAPPNGGFPMSLAFAVDLNKNGVRDMDEPIIRSGHEPWTDSGEDGVLSAQEPGYDAQANPDPNQDDYDAYINPNGTEGDHYYQMGEPFQDVGLDGVPNTAAKNVAGDVGEGDGKYTMTAGLQRFYQIDPDATVRQRNSPPGGALDDKALERLDILADGGLRDYMNMGAASRHLISAIAGRRRADGTPLKTSGVFHGFDQLPGQPPGVKDGADIIQPTFVRWADMPASPMVWYGNVDATPDVIMSGDGMHVGTAAQVLSRIQTAFFYVAQRWPDADRLLTEATVSNPETITMNELGSTCEIAGRCEKIFVGPTTKRAGPIAITLPPGYALEENRTRNVRYPVVYVLHGYGQDPRDLEALALITNNFMNDGQRSYNSRLPKFITVYVDGRCRLPEDANGAVIGVPECYQGTFYLDSPRNNSAIGPWGVGPQLESWMGEVMQYIDANYRTMGPTDVDVLE